MLDEPRLTRPATAMQTYLGIVNARLHQLSMGLYALLATLAVLAGLVVLLTLALVRKPLTYITVSGVERAGIVSQANAQDFVRDFLHWMLTFTWATIDDRNPYIVPRICPALISSATPDLDAESAEVRRHAVSQNIAFKSMSPIPGVAGADFAFEVTLERSSQVLSAKTVYAETYRIGVEQAPNNDATRRLCISQMQRLNSKIISH
jgi:hypothetical protein